MKPEPMERLKIQIPKSIKSKLSAMRAEGTTASGRADTAVTHATFQPAHERAEREVSEKAPAATRTVTRRHHAKNHHEAHTRQGNYG